MPKISQLPLTTTAPLTSLVPVSTDTTATGTKAITADSFRGVIILVRDTDQLNWERLLSSNGAVFNGTTDDAPAVQASLNTLCSDNKFHKVAMPSGGLTMGIGSVNTCSYADPLALTSPPSAGLVIPVNAAIDFNLMTLQVTTAGATAIGSTGTAVALAGNTNLATAFPVHMEQWSGLTIASGGVGWGLWLGNGGGDRGPDRATFRNVRVINGLNGVRISDTTYLVSFCESYFSCTTSDCVQVKNTNGGENNRFFGCTFDHEGSSSASSTVIGLECNTDSDTYLYGCSFDFLKTALFTNSGVGPFINIHAYGCHFEMNKSNANWTSTSAYIRIADNAGATQSINLFGGSIRQDNQGTGTQLPQICRSGVTGQSAPWGITLDRVLRVLQGGTTINLNTDTGRFTDNQ